MVGAMWKYLLCLAALAWPAVAAADPPAVTTVAEGVHAFVGADGDIDPANRGRIGNSGFLVGDDGIVVIDTGVSDRHGRDLLAAIRRVSALPIRLVILTHAVQEFLYGTTAFVDAGAEVLAHAESAKLMHARCAHCLENLRLILGEDEMAGTRLVFPTRLVEATTELRVAGRDLRLIHPGWAATPGDLMVLDRATGVLFAGTVVVNGRIPELRDGRLGPWLEALDALGAEPVSRIVPGYGPPIAPVAAARTGEYLRGLDAVVRDLYAANVGLMDAVDRAVLPAFEGWSGYATVHRKNALTRYLQLETEDLER